MLLVWELKRRNLESPEVQLLVEGFPYSTIWINDLNKSFMKIINNFCKTNIMKDNNNSNPSWEQVRGLAWIFVEE